MLFAIDFDHNLEPACVISFPVRMFSSCHEVQIFFSSYYQSDGVDQDDEEDDSLDVEDFYCPVVGLFAGVVYYLYLFLDLVLFVEDQQLGCAGFVGVCCVVGY